MPWGPAVNRVRLSGPVGASGMRETWTERHAVVMALVTLSVVLGIGLLLGAAMGWGLLSASRVVAGALHPG